MRLLHVMPNVSRAFGGPTESLIGYAQASDTQDIEVHVAAPAVSDDDEAWLHDQLPEAWPLRTPGGLHIPPLNDEEGTALAHFLRTLG